MICSVRVKQLLAAVVLFGILPMAAQAAYPCDGANNCIQVVDTNSDGNLSDELQAAWNSLAYGPTQHSRIVLFPPPAQASGSPRYRLDKRVRFCFDSSPPSGSNEPNCDGAGALPTIEFAGLWDLECNLANPVAGLQLKDYCLWIGDAWNDGFGNLLNVKGRVRIHQMHATGAVVPFFCDGCTGAGPLRYEQTWEDYPIIGEPCGVFAGGPKRIDLDCQYGGPVLDGLHEPYTTIAGQIGQGAPPGFGGRTIIGTGEVGAWGDADGCGYGAPSVYEEYPCHIVIAEDSDFYTDLRTYGPIGTLTINGAVTSRGNKAVLLHNKSASGAATPFEAIRIHGRLTAAAGSINPVVTIKGADLAALDPTPTVVIDGDLYHGGTGTHGYDHAMTIMNCQAPNEDLPVLHIGPNARFQVPSGSVTTHWLREDQSCGVRAWNEEAVVVRDDVSDSGADPGAAQCWNWNAKTWDSCSSTDTYWYHPHRAPKVFVSRGQVVAHRAPGSTTSCNLQWLKNGADTEAFNLGGTDLDEDGERLARMLSVNVDGDVDYLQLEIDNGPGGDCWPNEDWGAFEVRLEMHEENFHRDAP